MTSLSPLASAVFDDATQGQLSAAKNKIVDVMDTKYEQGNEQHSEILEALLVLFAQSIDKDDTMARWALKNTGAWLGNMHKAVALFNNLSGHVGGRDVVLSHFRGDFKFKYAFSDGTNEDIHFVTNGISEDANAFLKLLEGKKLFRKPKRSQAAMDVWEDFVFAATQALQPEKRPLPPLLEEVQTRIAKLYPIAKPAPV